MSEGCNEQLTWEFIRYVWDYPSTRKPRILARLSALSDEKKIMVLKTQQQMDVFLTGISNK